MARRRLPDAFCLVCRRIFSPTRPWQQFCSPTCRREAHQAERLTEYACTYCGLLSNTIDHVPPRSTRPSLIELGLAARYPFVEVQCCHECNSLLGDRPLWTVPSRKRYIKTRLKQRYWKYLRMPDWADSELMDLSDRLREYVLNGLAVRDLIRKRLEY